MLSRIRDALQTLGKEVEIGQPSCEQFRELFKRVSISAGAVVFWRSLSICRRDFFMGVGIEVFAFMRKR